MEWTYRCWPFTFSLVNHFESLGRNRRDNVRPLVSLVVVGVVSDMLAGTNASSG